MQPKEITCRYSVRALNESDVAQVYRLLCGNPLFYEYHPPRPTEESVLADMRALPNGKSRSEKWYVGFFDGADLVAVADIVWNYPQNGTAFIGFFMTAAEKQGQGLGSFLVSETCAYFLRQGMRKARLAVDEGNPQSEAFWRKNAFLPTGERTENEFGAYVLYERILK